MSDLVNEQNLLDEYKKYDFLNKEKAKIKILVSYIKPSFLFKSEILTPIHLGRAVEKEISKDGIQSDEDINWLHQNCIGDDINENISKVNRKVGFLTGTYWAWKNYEKLGNPEYFGCFGYRRLMIPYFLNKIDNYDIILPEMETMSEGSLNFQMQLWHGKELFHIMQNCIEKIYPNDKELFFKYMSNRSGYFREIYVMKKHVFFEFCSWIFPLLFELLEIPEKEFEICPEELFEILKRRKESKEEYYKYKMRDIAFIMERLTGFFLYKITQSSVYKCFVSGVVSTSSDNVLSKTEKANLMLNLKEYKAHIDKLNLQKLDNITLNESKIGIVSVVNNYSMYNKYIKSNLYLKKSNNIHFVDFDNTKDSLPVPVRYNQFLNLYDYSKESWFLFCHPDWEISDDIYEKLEKLEKNKIYGPAGARLINLRTGIYRIFCGFTYEATRDGALTLINKSQGDYFKEQKADTLDCLAMFVHSSLVKKYNLRFDENLKWDLYIEDFCINAFKNFNIETNTFYFENTHHSDAGFRELPMSYYLSQEYLREKYPQDIFAGTCGIIGGREYVEATSKDIVFYKLRKGMK